MTDGLAGIVAMLENQKAAIDRALSALREVTGEPQPASALLPTVSGRKGYKLSAEARERMSQGQRKRYGHLHTVPEPPAPAIPTAEISGRKGKKRINEAPKPKRKISPEGIKRIIAATKKRWARVRAEAKAALENGRAKKVGSKKATA